VAISTQVPPLTRVGRHLACVDLLQYPKVRASNWLAPNVFFRAQANPSMAARANGRHVARRPDLFGDDAPVGLEERHALPAIRSDGTSRR